MGPEVQAFEREFAATRRRRPRDRGGERDRRAPPRVPRARRLGAGDEVVQPAMNFVAAANMTLAVGATPVFADIVAVDDPTVSPCHVEALVGPRHARDRRDALRRCSVPDGGDHRHRAGPRPGGHRGRLPRRRRDLRARSPGATPTGSSGVWAISPASRSSATRTSPPAKAAWSSPVTRELAERVRLLRSHGMTTLTWDRFQGQARAYDVVGARLQLPASTISAPRWVGSQLAKLPAGNVRRRALVEQYRTLARAALVPRLRARRPCREHSAHHLMVLIAPDAGHPRGRHHRAARRRHPDEHALPVHHRLHGLRRPGRAPTCP